MPRKTTKKAAPVQPKATSKTNVANRITTGGRAQDFQGITLVQFLVSDIVTADENALLYNRFSIANDDDRQLAEDIRENGIRTPLTVSADKVLLSGHGRLASAKIIGLEFVPVQVEPIQFKELNPDERVKLLRSYNQGRDKTFDERMAEALVDVSSEDAYRDAVSYRIERSRVSAESNVRMGAKKARAEITTIAFLDAVVKIVNGCRDEWPISNRAIHYLLLNDPPLTHDSKPDSHYRNEKAFTAKLSSLLTRARIAGWIPMEAICDEERPVTTWDIYQSAASFVSKEQERYLRGYSRDLMQSQPHHIEIIVEKRTKYQAAQNVAMNYTIPVTAGKGFASLAPRYQISKRYEKSRKEKLILIFLTDFDPDGEQIAACFARSMRDDFGIIDILPIKAALTAEQVRTLNLPSSLEAKPTSPNFKKFVAKYGAKVVELDAMPGPVLADALTNAINSVLDIEAFNHEVNQERAEQAELAARRKATMQAMGGTL